MIQNAVQDYVDLCMNLCVEKSDYGDKKKLTKHNQSMKLLRVYTNELAKTSEGRTVLEKLLSNPNIVVSTTAAADCLRLNLHKELATDVLKNAIDHKNPIVSFNAKMLLKLL